MTSSFANKYSPSCINDALLLPKSCQFFSFPMESSYNAQGMSRATLLGLSGAIPYSRPYLPFYSSLFRGHFFHYFFVNFYFSIYTSRAPCFFSQQISRLDLEGGVSLRISTTLFSELLFCDPFLPNNLTEHWLCFQQ